MIGLYSAGLLAMALLGGHYLHNRIALFQRFLIQPALLAGVILLIAGPEATSLLGNEYYSIWKTWPGYLISFLFAALMLGSERFSGRDLAERAVWQEGLFVWFMAAGQLALGFGVVLVARLFVPVDPLVAHIIELGWVGGHGAAGSFKALFPHSYAGDLAIFSATIGLLWGSFSGLLLVGYIRRRRPAVHLEGIESAPSPPDPAPGERRDRDLLLTVLLLLACVFSAYLIRDGLVAIVSQKVAQSIRSLPVFFLAMFTGIAARLVAGRISEGIQAEARRLLGLILDLLIASAIAALALAAFLEHFWILLLLMGVAAVWCIVCLLFFGPRLLPREFLWELGILNYGMATGITALGLLLLQSLSSRIPLRPVQIYGLAAPLSAPFIGGGVVSLLLPYFNTGDNMHYLAAGLTLATLLFYLAGRLLQRESASRGGGVTEPGHSAQ